VCDLHIPAGDYKDLAMQYTLAKLGDFEQLRAAWLVRGASKAEIAKRLAASAKVRPASLHHNPDFAHIKALARRTAVLRIDLGSHNENETQ
jgi:hypothetical protein